MSFVTITVKIDIEPNETEVGSNNTPSISEDGCFQLIVDSKSSMDIDVLEDCLLQTNYLAKRDALAQYMELESEKKALKKSHQPA